MIELKQHIQTLRKNLDKNIRGLADFKTAMQTIGIVQSTTLSIEYKVKEMQETFSVLQDHSIKVCICCDFLLYISYKNNLNTIYFNVFLVTTFVRPYPNGLSNGTPINLGFPLRDNLTHHKCPRLQGLDMEPSCIYLKMLQPDLPET